MIPVYDWLQHAHPTAPRARGDDPFGHSEEYYRRRKDTDAYYDLCSELFANCCSAIATNDITAIKALKLVVPNFFEEVVALFG